MTTLIGICSEDNSEVVLAADRQGSTKDKEGKPDYKLPIKKLYVDNNRKIALGTVGLCDENTQKLVRDILEGKLDIEKVIADGKFPALLDLNLVRSKGRLPLGDDLTGLLLATRQTSPKLFTCFPFGSVEPRETTYVGSGSKYAEEYFNAERVIVQARPEASILEAGKVSPKSARELAYRAVRHAAKFDPYSSGLDMVIVSADGITEFGDRITEQEDLAQKNILKLLGVSQ